MGTEDSGGLAILPKIHNALEVQHSPYSNNDSRREAHLFLEEVKNIPEAPSHGFLLASDKTQPPVVRHYALSLLEHAIKHKWAGYTYSEAVALRNWVLELAHNISKEDPAYLRKKIATLWVEIAKRSWVASWMDMDSMLVQLWQLPESPVHKEMVLSILENLVEDIYNQEDDEAVDGREDILGRALVDIFTSPSALQNTHRSRHLSPDVRCGDEGWLARITELLRQCFSVDLQNQDHLRGCAIQGLVVISTLMPYAIPKALTMTGCVPVMCEGLRASHVDVQKVGYEFPIQS